jgi:hypothetical protein
MARPTKITPAVESAIQRLGADGASLPALRAALAAEGFDLSVPTLQRYRARQRQAPAGDAVAADDDLTPIGLADELRRRYVEVRAVVERVRAEAMGGGPALSRWLRAVDAFGATAERLARMVPPPAPDPETDPAHVAAKARLLARVDEVLGRAGN